MKISFVIPCYGSETTISQVVDEVISVIHQRNTFDYEVILVNDYSPDHVWNVIKDLEKKNNKIKGICLSRNFGQHSALLAGYRYCTGDYIVSLDDDGQTPIDELYKLVDKLEEGFDAVYACYYEIKSSPFRRLGTKMAKFMGVWLLDMPKDLQASSFYIARKYVISEMIRYENSYPYVLGLLLRTTRNVTCVKTSHRKRIEGKSGYNLKKLFSLWLNGFTAFSVKPLEVGIYVGSFTAVIGFIAAIVTVIRKLINTSIAIGWSSVISVMLILGGMILIMLGLIGEYVGRMYISINNAPQYVIKEVTENILENIDEKKEG